MEKDGRLRGTLWVLLCVMLWALIPVASKFGQAHLDNHQFLFWSSLVSFAVLAGTAAVRGQWNQLKALKIRELLYLVFLGLLGTYVYYLFLYLGYAVGEGMEVLVMQYTWPFFIVLLSAPILKERLGFRSIAAVILGFGGVVLVLTKGSFADVHFSDGRVIALVLLGAFCFALFSVLGKSVHVGPIPATTVYFFSATVASAISMTVFSGWALPSSGEILPVLLNGVLINGFSYVFWIFALRAASASFIAPFTYLTPVVSAFYLILVFSEPVLPVYVIGVAMVMAGGLVNSLPSGKSSGKIPRAE